MNPKQILVVESDARQARILRSNLEQAAYEVVCASTLEEALEHLAEAPFDLVLAATALPDRDGFELVETMRERDEWQGIPLVLMIDGDVRAARTRGMRLGVVEFLTKPVFVKEMLSRVRTLLGDSGAPGRGPVPMRTANAEGTSGDLVDTPAVELLDQLANARKSGTVTFRSGDAVGIVYFRQGAIVDATLKQLRAEEAVFRLLTWTEGTYEVKLAPSARTAVTEMDTRDMLDFGARQAAEFRRLARQLPPLDSILVVDSEMLDQVLADVPEAIDQLLGLFDGQRTLDAILDESPFDARSTLGTLKQLHTEGVLVEAEATARPPVAGRGVAPRVEGGRAVFDLSGLMDRDVGAERPPHGKATHLMASGAATRRLASIEDEAMVPSLRSPAVPRGMEFAAQGHDEEAPSASRSFGGHGADAVDPVDPMEVAMATAQAPDLESLLPDEPVYLTHAQIERRTKSRKYVLWTMVGLGAVGLLAVLVPLALRKGESPTAASAATGAPTAVAVAPSAETVLAAVASAAATVLAPSASAPVDAAASASAAPPSDDLPDVKDPLAEAMAKLDKGLYSDSIRFAKAAIAREPDNADGYFALLTAYQSLGRWMDTGDVRKACNENATRGQYRSFCGKKK